LDQLPEKQRRINYPYMFVKPDLDTPVFLRVIGDNVPNVNLEDDVHVLNQGDIKVRVCGGRGCLSGRGYARFPHPAWGWVWGGCSVCVGVGVGVGVRCCGYKHTHTHVCVCVCVCARSFPTPRVFPVDGLTQLRAGGELPFGGAARARPAG